MERQVLDIFQWVWGSHWDAVWGFVEPVWPLVWTLVKIFLIIAPLMLCVAYLTLAERKVIGAMQVRLGPNRVGPAGYLQPIADGLKLLFKEVIVPSQANTVLYILAPILSLATALAAWAVVPFGETLVLANDEESTHLTSLSFTMVMTAATVFAIRFSWLEGC